MRRRPPGPRTPQPPSPAQLAARVRALARLAVMLLVGPIHLLRVAWQLHRLTRHRDPSVDVPVLR